MKEYAEKLEFIDAKKITSELLDVLSRHDLAVADAIRMLEMTKNKILIKLNLIIKKMLRIARVDVESFLVKLSEIG